MWVDKIVMCYTGVLATFKRFTLGRLQPKSGGMVWSYFRVNFWGLLFWRYRKKHSCLKPLCRHAKQLFIPRSWISLILMQILFTFNRLGSPNMGLFEAQGVSDQTKKPKWFKRTNHRIGPDNSSTNARANSQSLTAFSSVLNSIGSFKAITLGIPVCIFFNCHLGRMAWNEQ